MRLLQAAQGSSHAEMSALAISQYQASTDADEVDLDLIEALLMYICGEGPYSRDEEQDVSLGAVLIFLPGASCTLSAPTNNPASIHIHKLRHDMRALLASRSQTKFGFSMVEKSFLMKPWLPLL